MQCISIPRSYAWCFIPIADELSADRGHGTAAADGIPVLASRTGTFVMAGIMRAANSAAFASELRQKKGTRNFTAAVRRQNKASGGISIAAMTVSATWLIVAGEGASRWTPNHAVRNSQVAAAAEATAS
jgi:hypothetical protein